jgi:tubulin delta
VYLTTLPRWRCVSVLEMIGIHAGQCGNQLGHCLLDCLYAHLSHGNNESHENSLNQSLDEDMNFYFRQNEKSNQWIARTVCMDTEPKVIHECVTSAKRSNKWKYCERNTHYLHGGAGNNWAMGYQLCSGEFRDAGIDSIRRELEDVDIPSTLVVIHSVGGGTGSGLGTRMTEAISDEVRSQLPSSPLTSILIPSPQFPDSSLLNISVMPYHFGEVVVQHYNSVLCLSKVAQASQSILLFENEVRLLSSPSPLSPSPSSAQR